MSSMYEEMEFIPQMKLREYIKICMHFHDISMSESTEKVLKLLGLEHKDGNHFIDKKRLELFQIKYDIWNR